MKPISRILFIIIVPVVLAGWVLSAQAEMGNVYTMSGRISAIDLDAGTVVVQVPMKNNQMMTVAGPLTQNATLKKRGKKTNLDAFKTGDHVRVTWQKTDKTLLIKALASER
jgi:Cu/Ag efflux protein CusF